jgi:hypothetical protein
MPPPLAEPNQAETAPAHPHPDAVAVDIGQAAITCVIVWKDATGQPVEQKAVQAPLLRLDEAALVEALDVQIRKTLIDLRQQVEDPRPVTLPAPHAPIDPDQGPGEQAVWNPEPASVGNGRVP